MDNVNSEDSSNDSSNESQRTWKPLNRLQRRVAGVLIEKSKTTPDSYPMSLNGVKTGSNQKSNRSPQLSLQEHEVDDVLCELREMGAVIEVHSGGRVAKYKHQLYDWLGVENTELAVMGELLLRGEQTLGDLRARASRMSKIQGQSELRPIIASLIEKDLIVELTPPGRGQMVTHNLYLPEELERLKQQFAGGIAPRVNSPSPPTASKAVSASPSLDPSRLEELESQVADLKAELAALKELVSPLRLDIDEIKELLK